MGCSSDALCSLTQAFFGNPPIDETMPQRRLRRHGAYRMALALGIEDTEEADTWIRHALVHGRGRVVRLSATLGVLAASRLLPV